MNLKRVVIFAAILLAAIAATAVPLGLIARSLVEQGGGVPTWFTVGGTLAVLAAAACVFFSLAAREPERPYKHAWAVCGIVMALTFAVNVLASGVPIGRALLSSAPLVLALLVGVELGRRHPKGPPGSS